jgi:hypothetical protein
MRRDLERLPRPHISQELKDHQEVNRLCSKVGGVGIVVGAAFTSSTAAAPELALAALNSISPMI